MKISKLFNFKYSKIYIACIFVLSIISSILTITYPMIIGNIVDKIGNANIINTIVLLLSVFIALFLVNTILNCVLAIYNSKLSKTLKDSLYKKLDLLSLSTIEKKKTGNIINLFTADIENISNGIIQNFSKILMGITTICFSVYILLFF